MCMGMIVSFTKLNGDVKLSFFILKIVSKCCLTIRREFFICHIRLSVLFLIVFQHLNLKKVSLLCHRFYAVRCIHGVYRLVINIQNVIKMQNDNNAFIFSQNKTFSSKLFLLSSFFSLSSIFFSYICWLTAFPVYKSVPMLTENSDPFVVILTDPTKILCAYQIRLLFLPNRALITRSSPK